MKKTGIITLALGLVFTASAFAADITASGVLVQSLQVGSKRQAAVADTYGFGKSRLTLNLKADDKVSVTYIGKLESNLSMDYIYADILTDLGKVRAGVIYDQIANFGGGIYQTNTFLANTTTKEKGLALYTKLANVNIGIFNILAPIEAQTTRVYGAKLDTTMDALYLGAVVKSAATKNKLGLAAEVEASYKIGAGKISAQYYTDLNNNSAVLFQGEAKKQAFLGLYGEYNLASLIGYGVGVYADYVGAANTDTVSPWAQSQSKIGAKYSVNPKATVYYELVSTKFKNVDAVGTSGLGLQINF
ncbi:MAG: hypothetical protein DKM50_12835 [Candidatus Margulisiibacteriota bacterium]|nr:MAG: hypothetical protein A2X43_07310 [Candidatus Margulisbacteria bacterium GWD2_39_127]PZM77420.1 MAG: hypothetical protein DKM50_12835 [Candidatus Margulisiibacteriota bacterium]HAR64101.1 hypothetical protein [Candidatus Margulisiibacteriota bacterium]HCY37555.1 hypothetical protein [Candidatus Margulisiibacteriota bacterium]